MKPPESSGRFVVGLGTLFVPEVEHIRLWDVGRLVSVEVEPFGKLKQIKHAGTVCMIGSETLDAQLRDMTTDH